MKKTTLFEGRGFDVVQYKDYNIAREIVERVDAACVLAFDELGNVILVSQERIPFGQMIEIPAGKVEEKEPPLECARRELEEETGYRAEEIIPLLSYHPSVGYTTERIHCFFATKLKFVGQKLDDGEKITVYKVLPEAVYDMIQEGIITDSKTIVAFLGWYGKKVIKNVL